MEVKKDIEESQSKITSEIENPPKDMQVLYYSSVAEEILRTRENTLEVVDRNTLELYVEDIKIIVFTATEVEKDSVLEILTPINKKNSIIQGSIKNETYYIGKLGLYDIVLTMCRPGSVQSALSSCDAFHFWKPKIAILCGIGYGLDKKNQDFGDVLVSEHIVPYEVERVGKKNIPRGEPIPSSPILLNRFKHVRSWNHQIIFGQILSGEKLLDNKKIRKELINKFPNAKGGDMEGAGFSLAAFRRGIHWIMVKGICDFAYIRITIKSVKSWIRKPYPRF